MSPVLATSGDAPDRLETILSPSDITFASLLLLAAAAASMCRFVRVGACVLVGCSGVSVLAVLVLLLLVCGCEKLFVFVSWAS